MKRLWAIVIWGVAMWGLSLVWPYANIALAPNVADAVIVGLVVATVAYVLGRQFTGNEVAEAEDVESTLKAQEPARPVVSVIFPFSRIPRSTRPIPELVGPGFHSRATQPVPVVSGRGQHSRITHPLPITR